MVGALVGVGLTVFKLMVGLEVGLGVEDVTKAVRGGNEGVCVGVHTVGKSVKRGFIVGCD